MSVQTVTVEGTQEIDGLDVEWKATVRLAYMPARLYGPPENCYPEESEAEIEKLETWPGFDDQIDEDRIIELAWEKFDERQSAADAADHADFVNDSLADR